MTESARNFMVGLFSIIAIIAFAVMLMFFGELDELTTRRYPITVHLNSAAGLRAGSTVEFNGVAVGIVDQITLQETPEYPVRVSAMISRDVRIPVGASGRIETQLIAGTASLQLDSGPAPEGDQPLVYLPTDGTAEIFVHYQPLLDQIVSELDARTAPFVQAVDAFERLSETYIAVGENLNALIQPQDPQAIADGEQPNFHAVIARFHDVVTQTQTTLDLAQNWLGDEQLRHELRDAVVNAGQLIEDAAATLSRVGEFTDRLEGRTVELVDRLVPIADDLSVIVEEVRQITRAANQGDGTIAQLLNNPDLYNNLNDAVIRMELALREVQLFIQKISAEGLPVRWF